MRNSPAEESRTRRFRFAPGRLFDLAAIVLIAFVAWKIFIAPRAFRPAAAYPAPRVAYPMLSGKTFRVSDARGRMLFLDFFASWCEPCRLEMPLVVRYARSHPGVTIVAVDVGEPRALAERFAKRFKLRDVALDTSSSARGFFQIEGFPTIVVIDPRGDIRATWSGFNPAIDLALSHAVKALSR